MLAFYLVTLLDLAFMILAPTSIPDFVKEMYPDLEQKVRQEGVSLDDAIFSGAQKMIDRIGERRGEIAKQVKEGARETSASTQGESLPFINSIRTVIREQLQNELHAQKALASGDLPEFKKCVEKASESVERIGQMQQQIMNAGYSGVEMSADTEYQGMIKELEHSKTHLSTTTELSELFVTKCLEERQRIENSWRAAQTRKASKETQKRYNKPSSRLGLPSWLERLWVNSLLPKENPYVIADKRRTQAKYDRDLAIDAITQAVKLEAKIAESLWSDQRFKTLKRIRKWEMMMKKAMVHQEKAHVVGKEFGGIDLRHEPKYVEAVQAYGIRGYFLAYSHWHPEEGASGSSASKGTEMRQSSYLRQAALYLSSGDEEVAYNGLQDLINILEKDRQDITARATGKGTEQAQGRQNKDSSNLLGRFWDALREVLEWELRARKSLAMGDLIMGKWLFDQADYGLAKLKLRQSELTNAGIRINDENQDPKCKKLLADIGQVRQENPGLKTLDELDAMFYSAHLERIRLEDQWKKGEWNEAADKDHQGLDQQVKPSGFFGAIWAWLKGCWHKLRSWKGIQTIPLGNSHANELKAYWQKALQQIHQQAAILTLIEAVELEEKIAQSLYHGKRLKVLQKLERWYDLKNKAALYQEQACKAGDGKISLRWKTKHDKKSEWLDKYRSKMKRSARPQGKEGQ